MKFNPSATVSEAQMKLAIAQTLSLPFAYNSPVMVLDFDLGIMYRNPAYLVRKDPEMFDFIYAVVRQR